MSLAESVPDSNATALAARGILNPFRLDGKVAVVTGASSGLGVAFAQALVEAGAAVVLGARRDDRLRECAADLVQRGGRVASSICDVRIPSDCEALVGEALERFGAVDILVNNAGVGAAIPATREDPDAFRAVVDTNLHGAYWCAQAFARVAGRGSAIVNVASTLALRPVAMPQAAYVASKAGLIGLTRDLALQWTGRKGIRVNALAPGYFPSEMTDEIPPEHGEMVCGLTPFGRYGRLSELTPALIFLCSNASSYMTGTTLAVDGGLSLH